MNNTDKTQTAERMGAEHGRAAASWYFNGNTSDETYRLILAGLEAGDPEILDSLPSSPLSGEWAGDPTPLSVLAELGVDATDEAADDLLTAYELAFSFAVVDEVERAAREAVS